MRLFLPSSRLLVVALALSAAGSVLSAKPQEKEKPPPKLITPINMDELLSAGGYWPIRLKDSIWEILELKYLPKNLNAVEATLTWSADNQTVRISVPIGVRNESADDEEFKSKLEDLNKRFKPTKLVLSQTRVFAVTDFPTEKIDQDTFVGAIEKTARDADSLYPEIATYVKLLERSGGVGTGAGVGTGGGIGHDPNAKILDSTINSGTNVSRSVDTKPVILTKVQPHYTNQAREEGIQGVVTLRVLVDEMGRPSKIAVIKGLPAGLTERAVDAARMTKFKPAMKDGKPVSYWIALQMSFSVY